MENSSNMSDTVDKLKNNLIFMKTPINHNLSIINEIIELFDKTTLALLNPIKKLKVASTDKYTSLSELEYKSKQQQNIFIIIKKYLKFQIL